MDLAAPSCLYRDTELEITTHASRRSPLSFIDIVIGRCCQGACHVHAAAKNN